MTASVPTPTKILFVAPPRWNEVVFPATVAMGGMLQLPPIGMLFVSSALKQAFDDVETRLFDYNIQPGPQDYGMIDEVMREFQPDIVGLTSNTFIMYDVYEVTKRIKQLAPNAKVVFGVLLWDANARDGPDDFEGKILATFTCYKVFFKEL